MAGAMDDGKSWIFGEGGVSGRPLTAIKARSSVRPDSANVLTGRAQANLRLFGYRGIVAICHGKEYRLQRWMIALGHPAANNEKRPTLPPTSQTITGSHPYFFTGAMASFTDFAK